MTRSRPSPFFIESPEVSAGNAQRSGPRNDAGLPVTVRYGRRVRGPAQLALSALLLLCGLAQVTSTVLGQGPNHGASKFYPDSSEKAETLLRNAGSLAQDGQWAEANEIYQRIIDQYGDKVAKLPKPKDAPAADNADEFVLFVDLRAYCHRALARLPAEARTIYRNRMDSLAQRWFQDGQSRRDPALLRRVVELAFCSSWGDDALELLGDMAFQDGRFGEALAMYRPLVPDRPDDQFDLLYPDPSVDLARIAAKKLLCRAAAGEKLVLASELERYGKQFPGASGALAGRKGSYLKILEESIRGDRLAPPAQPDSRWPTFAGSFARTRVVAEPIDVGSLQWKVALERITPHKAGYNYGFPRNLPTSSSTPQDRLLGYFPIVLGDQVIVGDGARVLAYNLNDRPGSHDGGMALAIEPAWKHDPETSAPQVSRPGSGIPRYTLTAVGNRVYARMGAATPSPFANTVRGGGLMGSSYIIALDWSAQGKLLWLQKSSDLVLPNRPVDRINRSVSFEGTPVADGRNVFVAVTDRREQTATYVVCFDAETGARRWVRYLGAASSEMDNFMAMGGMGFAGTVASDYGHRLLSLEGAFLYYQTNLGAVIALEAETGVVRWVANYPRQDSGRMGGSDRDLNPAVVHDGLVIVAPTDAAAIYAFAADSGRLVWKTEPIAEEVKLTHLLGVASGRLVATGDRVLLFDVKTGKLAGTWPDSGKSEGYGRGLLAGNRIYWPTHDRIEVLDQTSGLRAEPPIKLMEIYRTTGGNLVAGDGYLIVAQPDALVVFCQNSRLIERYRDEIAHNPEQAATYFRLARAAEAVGRNELALVSYDQAAHRARTAETIDGVPLADAARNHEFRLLLRVASAARCERKLDAAIGHVETASRIAQSDADRLGARLMLADLQMEAGRPTEAIAILEQVLSDDRLRGQTVSTEDGHRAIRADLLIADRLSLIVKQRGRSIYAASDRHARELYERGRREQDPRLLEEVSRSFPVAEVVPAALVELGQVHQNAGRTTAAIRAYKRLLTLAAVPDEARARALWRLAHLYEAQNYLVSARDTYLQIQTRYPRIKLQELENDVPLGERVSSELARGPLAQIALDRPRATVPLPLARRWHLQSQAGRNARTLGAIGTPPSLQSSRAFAVEGSVLSPLDPLTGEPRWSVDLGSPAAWVGYLSDKVVAASAQRVVGLDPGTGTEQWRFAAGMSARARRLPDPFARNDPAANAAEAPKSAFHDFRLVGGRLFCLRGDEELIAIDAENGTVDWSFTSKDGAINPKFWIGPERGVVQVQNPNRLLVIDTDSGRQLARVSLADGESLESAPVPVDEDHVLLVPDRRTVKNLDLTHGQFTWNYRESAEMPVNGPPRVLVDAERVLVLHDGRVLIRLDPQSGARRWSTVLGIEDLSDRLDAIACDDRRVYCASQQTLRALSVDDGSPLWAFHLTGPENALWSIALSDRWVLAYPSLSNLSEGEMESMPVVVRRQETGALVQRFVFSATIADVNLKLDSRGVLVATCRNLWALSRRDGGPESKSSPLP